MKFLIDHLRGSRLLIVLLILAVILFKLTTNVSAGDREEISFENGPHTKLDNPTPVVDDQLGWRTAISGDTIAVLRAINYVQIYQRDQGGTDHWGFVTEIDNENKVEEIALDGDILFTGDKIYYRDQGGLDNWGFVHALSHYHGYTQSAVLVGDVLAVGFYDYNPPSEVRIYYKDQGGADQWGLLTTLVSPSSGIGYALAQNSLAMSGDLLAVGAYSAKVGAVACGEAYVYSKDEGGADQWGQVGTLQMPGDCDAEDNFGANIAMYGQLVAVGVQFKDWMGMENLGAVYIYHKNSGGVDNWGFVRQVGPPGLVSFCRFGYSLTISDDFLYVYSDFYRDQVFVYQRNRGGTNYWGLVPETLHVPGDPFFLDLYNSGDVFVASWPWEEGPSGEYRLGAVYLWMGGEVDLDLAKTVSADQVSAGDPLTYTLTVTNDGPLDAEDLVLTDYLPSGVTLQSVTGVGWTCDSSGEAITCTLPNLALGASAEDIVINVKTDSDLSGWINNVATITSYNVEMDFENNQQVELTEVIYVEYRSYLPLALR
jgi:uncharacterized repeat protein (TIGR01451 family)